jgi:hypothetical protein
MVQRVICYAARGASSSPEGQKSRFMLPHADLTHLPPWKPDCPATAQAEFEAKWGLSWDKALEDGNVYNAVDGCKKLGIDGETMDSRWGATKKAGELVKFGGGFYCGKLALSA